MTVTVDQIKALLKIDSTQFDAYISTTINNTYVIYDYLDALGASAEHKDEVVKYASAYRIARQIGTFPKSMQEALLEHLRGLLSKYILAT